MTTVLIADDHAVVADGLAILLKDKFEVAGVVHDGRALLDAAESLRPNVILTDISMPGLNGIDAIRKIREQLPEAKIVVLTMHADPQLAAQAFRLGATGYVLKNSPGDELIAAIQEVDQGHAYLSPLIAKGFINVLLETGGEPSVQTGNLTARQREVLQLIAEGKTMKEIAAVLHISPRTVESHKYEMMQILGVTSSAELVQHAVRLKLVGGR
ncbi:MAG TPA: response regulator transcription factor [Bryobacteraceae bacterium]|jgi:DNA-binding NarL/FixJ family response regulator